MPLGRHRNFNPGNWLLGLGLLGLAATFWFPVASASRSARVEERAGHVASLLLAEAVAMQPLDLQDPWAAAVLLARLQRACAAAQVFGNDLEPVADAGEPPQILLRNKHYLFAVAATPPDPRLGPPPADSIPPLTVLAWPLDRTSPGHAAYFLPEGDDATYTRNLQAAYAAGRRPQVDAGQRRPDPVGGSRWAHRGRDDERWLVLRGPILPQSPRSSPTGSH